MSFSNTNSVLHSAHLFPERAQIVFLVFSVSATAYDLLFLSGNVYSVAQVTHNVLLL